MTKVARYTPFERLEARFFEPFFRFPYMQESAGAAAWNPAVDVLEENERIVVKMEVPGVDEKDLSLTFQDGLLTVSGERQFEQKDGRNYHRIERAYGSFSRTFTLPRSVDGSKIEAGCRNGILEIAIPKREDSRPRQIQINATDKQLEA
jgi:HSP20 family protein